MPHISLKAEPVFELGHFLITNSLLTAFFSLFVIIFVSFFYQNQLKKDPRKRSLLFYFIQFINKTLYKFFYSVFQDRTEYFYPIITGFFLYILLQNWLGLLPGVGSILIKVKEHGEFHYIPLFRGGTADLNTTLFLGALSVAVSQFYSIKFLGLKGYIGRFYQLKNPMSYFVGTLEIISEFSKIISFSFRLFGNVFAGEVLLTIMAFLVPVLAPIPFFFLEVFVGFIQALVFSMLTAVFISLAVSPSRH
jgi:F-type H+-transporting ATPase subunit a